MTTDDAWSAPPVERVDPPYVADERQMLETWLDFHRQTLLTKCAGLDREQLKRRSAEPSTLTLLGLVRHMAQVEHGWFREVATGEAERWLYGGDDNVDGDLHDVDTADAVADFATFEAEVAAARTAVADLPLDTVVTHPRRGYPLSLRWIYVHMIEEYARHNGHADLLRERIDGAVGD
jgi:uncharacterized damage-inducible protein DinB